MFWKRGRDMKLVDSTFDFIKVNDLKVVYLQKYDPPVVIIMKTKWCHMKLYYYLMRK